MDAACIVRIFSTEMSRENLKTTLEVLNWIYAKLAKR